MARSQHPANGRLIAFGRVAMQFQENGSVIPDQTTCVILRETSAKPKKIISSRTSISGKQHVIYRYLDFGYTTGWRHSEIATLTWRQVDLDRETVILDPGDSKNEERRTGYLDEDLKPSCCKTEINGGGVVKFFLVSF
jgi:hypothetical protein